MAGQRALNQVALDFIEAHFLEPDRATCGGGAQAEVGGADQLPLREQDAALNGVIELANIAGPGMFQEKLRRAGVEPQYDAKQLSAGVLARPTVFQNAVLYLFMSESGRDEPIDVRDKLTGAEMKFTLPEQRAVLVLLNKKDRKVIGKYGVADVAARN